MSACSNSDSAGVGTSTPTGGPASSGSGTLKPVSTIPPAQASSMPAASAWARFATSAPTTGASASAQGQLPAEVDAASFPHTREGAETFARTYLAAAAEGLSTADSSGLRGWSAASCEACSEQIEKIDLMKARGQRPREPVVTHANLTTGGRGDQYVVKGTVAEGAIALVDGHGAVVFTQSARNQALQLVISWVGGRWVVSAQNEFDSQRH